MGFREVSVVEVKEVLRGWLEGSGLRTVAERAGVDRKTARRYVAAAQAAGLQRDARFADVDDVLVAQVVSAVRPARPNGHGTAWEALEARQAQIAVWLAGDGKDAKPLSVVKVHELLSRQGCVVPYRTLHRFAAERCGFRAKDTTVRVADGEPGVELQVDFGHLGYLTGEDGRRRKVHALIFTACYSRHMFVWLTYSQTLVAIIAGCEAAWTFFQGVFKILIPDNMKAIVTDPDPVNPRLSQGWLDYAQHVGFGTDPARVRSPKDKPKVERAVQYVRGNFWAGEEFTSLEEAQQRATVWCAERAGMRIHGTLQARPAEVFDEQEAAWSRDQDLWNRDYLTGRDAAANAIKWANVGVAQQNAATNRQNAATNQQNAATRRDQLNHTIQKDAASSSNTSFKQQLELAKAAAAMGNYEPLEELMKKMK